jgi:beta-N-acetylglucosaminidase
MLLLQKKGNPLYMSAHALLERAAGTSITAVNDGEGHARVIKMYNQAIAMAKGK